MYLKNFAMQKLSAQQLIEAILAANEAAKQVDQSPRGGSYVPGSSHVEWDGGTCNFDAPVVNFKGYSKAEIPSQINEIRVSKMDYGFWKGWYRVSVDLNGQGANRTRMAEAASRKLTEAGLEASVYYQMD